MIKALHTSDWHLGAQLYEKDRLEEQRLFLSWLAKTIETEKIRVLVISGDIFDNYAPSVPAQTLYYEFLAGMLKLKTPLEIFIIAGNHDSPQFLNAPKEILSHLQIHIVSDLTLDTLPNPDNEGSSLDGFEHEIFEIKNEKNIPLLAVCAVPFLRERDLKLITDLGSDSADAAVKYRDAAAAHYRRVVERARKKIPGVPVLVTGHLFLSGAVLSDDTSERLREVGKLSSLPADMLPEADYYALGHLHRPQCIAGNERRRYSGSPIAMSFSEAGQDKSVVIIEFDSAMGQYDLFSSTESSVLEWMPRIELRAIPRFSELEQIRGDTETIRKRLAEIQAADEKVFIDIQVTSCAGNIYDFWDEVNNIKAEALEKRSRFSILAAQDKRTAAENTPLPETLTEVSSLQPVDVFVRKLEAENITEDEREIFTAMFREIEELVRRCGSEDSEAEQ
ncbi:nuclease SbcCD subunit D [Spirochaetia bacterium]|nr:nuclease SbcCD subunit D [Spirochaetia bacterium]